MKTNKKILKSITKTINDTNSPSSLKSKLKTADLEIQQYIAALATENLILQKKVAKCEAQKTTFENRVTILENNLKEEKNKPKLVDYIETLQEKNFK